MTTAANSNSVTPIKTFQADALAVRVYASQADLSQDVARITEAYLRETIAAKGSAAAIMATGNSQIKFRERVQSRVKPRAFHYLEGDALLPMDECERYAKLLQAQPIDLCCLGVGENGHLAFNDPPIANFEDQRVVTIGKLDDACRMQQVGEGHFANLDAVPPYALTLTIPALCSAKKMLCIAPETRKARVIKAALQGPITTACPASILRRQAHATLFLDKDSASLL
jgi:glucosamine-6-phosphate deaminase